MDVNANNSIGNAFNVSTNNYYFTISSNGTINTNSLLPSIKPEYEFIENPELLLKIKMKLRNSNDLICDFTEEEIIGDKFGL